MLTPVPNRSTIPKPHSSEPHSPARLITNQKVERHLRMHALKLVAVSPVDRIGTTVSFKSEHVERPGIREPRSSARLGQQADTTLDLLFRPAEPG
jgi:hypothetical protein